MSMYEDTESKLTDQPLPPFITRMSAEWLIFALGKKSVEMLADCECTPCTHYWYCCDRR